jgi:glycosyltransferase involved in cell wall biosynthesis
MANAPIAAVIPVYNRRRKLANTLASVVAQIRAPSLLVVVDDGSTDGTGEIAESWLAHNAKFERKAIRQPNAAAAAARNASFAEIGELPPSCAIYIDRPTAPATTAGPRTSSRPVSVPGVFRVTNGATLIEIAHQEVGRLNVLLGASGEPQLELG